MVTRTPTRPTILNAREIADTRDIEQVARWLDTRWTLPGTTWRFGLDTVIGLVPGVGDGITAVMGAYIIVRARELGAPGHVQARMIGNLVVDSLVGAIPLVGDIFDFAYRSNAKNVQLLLRHLEEQGRR